MKRSCFALFALLLASAGTLRADQTTSMVQQALKEQGFYYGDVNGEKTADTTAAIRRYQIRNGLQITGEIDAETLRSLGVGLGTARAAMAIASGLCGLAQAKAVAASAEAMARNPGASAAIRFALLLGLVLIESLALYTLVIIFAKVTV